MAKKTKKDYIFNPLNEDFKIKYDKKEYTVRSKEVAEYPKHIIKHMKRGLANKIFDMRYSYSKRRDTQMEEIYKSMKVKI